MGTSVTEVWNKRIWASLCMQSSIVTEEWKSYITEKRHSFDKGPQENLSSILPFIPVFRNLASWCSSSSCNFCLTPEVAYQTSWSTHKRVYILDKSHCICQRGNKWCQLHISHGRSECSCMAAWQWDYPILIKFEKNNINHWILLSTNLTFHFLDTMGISQQESSHTTEHKLRH